jgi:superfamily II DNA or RNA helicase
MRGGGRETLCSIILLAKFTVNIGFDRVKLKILRLFIYKIQVLNARLTYDNGTILIKGLAHIPFASTDPRTNLLRAPALYYANIIEFLKQSSIEYVDHVLDLIPSPHFTTTNNTINKNNNDHNSNPPLRTYQNTALSKWTKAGMRGCVVLPTGSGKTIIGVKAIEAVNSASLIVVPTLDLMDQWTSVLKKYFTNVKIGNLGGGIDDIEAITISTYDSAYIRASSIGNKFSLIIFDEVHHLAAPGYRSIAELMASPFRLGLTATIEREDGMHMEIPKLVGGIVFTMSPNELAEKKHLAQYEIERRRVEMLPDEIIQYRKNFEKYQYSLRRLGFRFPIRFEKLIMISAKNKIAREALLARNKAMEIALNSRSKIEELREILAENKGIKTIIFTQHNNLVYQVSNTFLIPFITYKTGKEERQDVLKGFREGRYNAVVTSKVLDEGVDVPDAELGIILSGTGSGREFIQRLGRLLRPKPDVNKKAKLIEIISADTREIGTSAKRKKALDSEDMTNSTELEEHDLDLSSGHISDNQSITIDIASS